MRDMLRGWMLAALFGLCAGACAFAAQPLQLDVAKDQPVQLGNVGLAWIDETGQASPEVVADGAGINWAPTHEGAIYRIAPGKTLWVRFTVIVPGTERWYLQIPYPAVDKVTLYGLEGTGGWGQEAGDTIAVGDWPVPHRFPLLPLSPGPQQYLVRIQNTHSFAAPLEFVSDAYLLRDAQQSSVILGIYFGLAGLAILLAMMSAVSLRDRSYALYAVSVVFMALTQASLTGIAGLNLWPDAPWWNDFSAIALPVVGVGSLQWFFSEVVSMGVGSRPRH
jgi:hypothetical protein